MVNFELVGKATAQGTAGQKLGGWEAGRREGTGSSKAQRRMTLDEMNRRSEIGSGVKR